MSDRDGLSAAQKAVLDEKIIPTARRWLRTHPALSQHAISTLEHWGEPLIDDLGNAWKPKRMGGAA